MLFSFILSASLLGAAVPDSLEASKVVADRGLVVSRTDTLGVNPLQDVSSTLQQLPGLYVGDYGSLAGLKSVSLRGLGSAHTAIYVDGVRVGNIQSGQADLGMLDFPSLGSIVADYAQNSLHFLTARPVFRGRPVAGEVRLVAGSFGTWQPYGRFSFKLGERWSLSANAGGVVTKGHFPLEDGSLRENNDLKQIRGGVDLFGLLDDGDFHAKAYYNGADRGTPGSLSWPSTDRQKDRNAFGQFLLRKAFGSVYSLHLSGKTSFDRLQYLSEWGHDIYEQTEVQLNSVHRFRLKPWWEVSLTADAALDGLSSTQYNGVRLSALGAVATAFRLARFQADAALEYAGVKDVHGAFWGSLSPSLDLRLKLVEGLDLVAFGRRAYRTPTFNELYYPGYGNPALKPEDAWLADAGLDFCRKLGAWTLKARADGYYNYLTNKIISAPSVGDPNIWLPFNVGKVQALGADIMAGFDFSKGHWTASFTGRYGWQKAVDKTPDSYTFDRQIPYVARHSAFLQGSLAYRGWTLGARWNLKAGRVDGSGNMPDWNTLDVNFLKDFPVGSTLIGVFVSARNLLNKRYDIVSGYPMPGRNFTGGASFRF